jgi:hypothetical protein
MSNHIPVLALSLILWVFLGYRFLRAFRRHRLTDRASLYAWMVFFLCYLVVALDVPSVELVINQRFDERPVTALARNLAILVTAQFFFLATRHVDAPSLRIKRIFNWVNPAIMLLMVLLFVGLADVDTVSSEVMTHSVKTIREAAMLLWTPLVFWPTLIRIWKLEQFRPMKLRYALSLTFYAAFVLECASGLLWTFTVFFTPALQAQAHLLDQVSSLICLLLFVVMLFPFRWLVLVFYPQQLWIYLRLRRLLAAVKALATVHPPVAVQRYNLARASELELAIYQHVIEILDLYPSISSSVGATLRQAIQNATENEAQYENLVERLAAIRL